MTPMSGWSSRLRRAAGAARAWPPSRWRRSAATRSPTSRPAPAPKVTEHVAQAKQCPCCGTVTEGELPPHVRARASFGPETCAQAANLTCGHHIPVYRATLLLCQLAGIAVSTGWMAGIRAKAAALVEASGFTDRVAGAAEGRARRARGRDPGPRGGRDAVRAPGLHRAT